MFWKIFSGVLFFLLLSSNAFWVYTSIDHAYSVTYSEDSCEKYRKDKEILLNTVKEFNSKEKTLEFLSKNDVTFDSFQKGKDEYIISLNSFGLTFNEEGKLAAINNY